MLRAAVHGASLTPADRVTLARAVLLGVVALLVLLRPAPFGPVGPVGPVGLLAPVDADGAATAWGWLVVALAVPMLLLDAVDGAVARRTLVTARGARFDMEVDAAAVLVLSLAAAPAVGAWVLLAGLLRYAWAVAALLLPALREPLPFSQARRVVAGVQGPALLAAVVPGVPPGVAVAACAVALVALLWSFGRDVAGVLGGAYRRQA
ncbi:CDP-alcohol phosphatidyltransferase family protein [Jannaschia sp. R86511]|uniref:CDP-alcohol phosphatidyltransferase family protein n=1 Tax=Jannaschia sp. R86511 TaxID=3093853 RepID=UPI0036D31D12